MACALSQTPSVPPSFQKEHATPTLKLLLKPSGANKTYDTLENKSDILRNPKFPAAVFKCDAVVVVVCVFACSSTFPSCWVIVIIPKGLGAPYFRSRKQAALHVSSRFNHQRRFSYSINFKQILPETRKKKNHT